MNIPVNANSTPAARQLLQYLYDIQGKGIITGQHTQTVPMEEITYIANETNRRPKLYGFELLAYSPNINYEDATEACLTEVYENRNTLNTAMKVAEETDAIITFSFHWFSPLYGHDKSFYAKNTEFDPREILKENTLERKAFYSDMDVIAQYLKPFLDKDIPILWRPFHESDGDWFWWGRYGCEVAKELYLLMYDYFVNVHQLNNLLWVWNCREKAGYPGDNYVDVVSVDVYLEKYEATDYGRYYEELTAATSSDKITALAEVGYIPDIDILKKTKIPWTYYMSWSKEFIIGEQYNSKDNLKKMYNSSYAISLESH